LLTFSVKVSSVKVSTSLLTSILEEQTFAPLEIMMAGHFKQGWDGGSNIRPPNSLGPGQMCPFKTYIYEGANVCQQNKGANVYNWCYTLSDPQFNISGKSGHLGITINFYGLESFIAKVGIQTQSKDACKVSDSDTHLCRPVCIFKQILEIF
jgi:hypothetical protein